MSLPARSSPLWLVVLLDGARLAKLRVRVPPSAGEPPPAAPRLAVESVLAFVGRHRDENGDTHG